MKPMIRSVGAVAAALCLAFPAAAQTDKTALRDKALDAAMTPGEGQKRLEPMAGSFSVRMLTWVHPSKPPVESNASAVATMVLGGRYLQTMLVDATPGSPFSGIGYVGYDNIGKQYQAAWMDTGSTGLTVYTGGFSADGRSATLKATVADAFTGKSTPLELRMSFKPEGGHVTQLWGMGFGDKMFKMMELHYSKAKN